MKTTIFLLSLLAFISCSNLEPYDSVLLELANDPRSEAIFATIAIQMRGEGEHEGGFSRILALLNELVDDGKKQLHAANKIWKAVEARCEVSEMAFTERQQYYETNSQRVHTNLEHANNDLAGARSTIEFYGQSHAAFETLRAEWAAEGREVGKQVEVRAAQIKAAIESVEVAVKEVEEWKVGAPHKQSFIQSKLDEVSAAYLQVHSFHIVVPEALVELAASDEQVKGRLLEWLGMLKVDFLDVENTYRLASEKAATLCKELRERVDALLAQYAEDTKGEHADVALLEDRVKTLQEAGKLMEELVSDNKKLVHANNEYCGVEKGDYEKARGVIESQLKLFRDVLSYFRTNYAKLSQYVKQKYH